jgi:hypothetical protein
MFYKGVYGDLQNQGFLKAKNFLHFITRLFSIYGNNLLDHIVAKNISHECQGMRKHFLKNHAFLMWANGLQFLLDEVAPMLINTMHS